MDPNAPLTVGQFYGAVLGIILGLVVGSVPPMLLFWLLERRDARRFGRRMEEDRRRWARQREIEDRLYLEGLDPETRERVLTSRQRQAELRRRVEAELAAEEARDGRSGPQDRG